MKSNRRTAGRDVFLALSIVLLGILIYYPVADFGFLTYWDDNGYVTLNESIRSLAVGNIRDQFTRFFLGNYAPIQMLTYAIDYRMWGLDPMGFHLTNLAFHLANALGVYFLIRTITGRRRIAWIAAALFAAHPVNVETVAWVSQRKTLVAELFFILSFGSYLRYASRGSRGAYLFSVACFAISLLSKVSAVALPLLLLLYDACYGRGIRRGQVLDKIPFAALSGLFSWIAVAAQLEFYYGTLRYHGDGPFANLLILLVALRRYITAVIAPLHLSAYYTLTVKSLLTWPVLASVVVLGGLAAWVWSARRDKTILFGALWFVIGLSPNFQIVPLDAVMADRYLYLPAIGVFLMAGHLYAKFDSALESRHAARILLRGTGLLVLILFAVIAARQTRIWKDDLSLWDDTVRTEPSALAYTNLAVAYAEHDRWAEAKTAQLEALAIDPDYVRGIMNIAEFYAREGEFERAAFYLKRAFALRPYNEEIAVRLASLYRSRKRIGEAKEVLESFLRRVPSSAIARENLAALERE